MMKLFCTKHIAQGVRDVSDRSLSWRRMVKSSLLLIAAAAVYIM